MLASTPNPVAAIAYEDVQTAFVAALKRPILDGIRFTIQPGEFVALLGLNGAGKSSLLRATVGLTPLQQGAIAIHGTPVAPRTLPHIRRDVGMLFQGGGLIRQLSALENVLCGRLGNLSTWQTLTGFSRSDRRHALDLLAQLGLSDLTDQKTHHLSGGQQQRVAIARALIQAPNILLVDEPVAGLDVLATRQVMDTLAQLNQNGMTIVAVLHDLDIAATYAQRAIVLDSGKVSYEGSCQGLAAQFTQATQVNAS